MSIVVRGVWPYDDLVAQRGGERPNMDTTTMVILGGYGNTGRALTRHLLAQTSSRLVLAGRDGARAAEAAASWNARFPGERVRGLAADASDAVSLRNAFEGADWVVVASSTAKYVETVASLAIEMGLDYMDPNYSTRKLVTLRSMVARIQAAGRCFITEAGFHPGLPAVLIRHAARYFESLVSAKVSSVIQVDWSGLDFSPATLEELVEEFLDYQALEFRKGRWQQANTLSMMFPKWRTFSHGFGRRYCMPMFLEELRPLPEIIPGLEETGFYVGGFNWVVDMLIMPLGMGLLKVWPKGSIGPVGRMMVWGLKRFGKPPYGTLLKLEARGVKAGADSALEVTVYHEDGYELTAVPMAACLLQALDGSIRRPGLWFQGLAVEPERMLSDMQRMGVEVRLSEA